MITVTPFSEVHVHFFIPTTQARFIKAPVGEDGRETTVPLDEPYEIDSEFNLPVSLAIFVSIAYIFLGALIYCQWETWTYLEAFYFIFISVSTIGKHGCVMKWSQFPHYWPQIAKFMGPTWGPPGSCRSAPDGPHVGPMNLAIRDRFWWNPLVNGGLSCNAELYCFICCNPDKTIEQTVGDFRRPNAVMKT